MKIGQKLAEIPHRGPILRDFWREATLLALGEGRRSAFCTLLRVRTGAPPTRPDAGRLSRKPAGSIGRHRVLI